MAGCVQKGSCVSVGGCWFGVLELREPVEEHQLSPAISRKVNLRVDRRCDQSIAHREHHTVSPDSKEPLEHDVPWPTKSCSFNRAGGGF